MRWDRGERAEKGGPASENGARHELKAKRVSESERERETCEPAQML